ESNPDQKRARHNRASWLRAARDQKFRRAWPAMDKQKFAQPETLLPKLLFRRLAREKRLGRAPGPRFVAVGANKLHLLRPSLESVEPTIRSFQSANSPRRNRANASTRRFTPFSGCNRANHLPAEPAEMRRARW